MNTTRIICLCGCVQFTATMLHIFLKKSFFLLQIQIFVFVLLFRQNLQPNLPTVQRQIKEINTQTARIFCVSHAKIACDYKEMSRKIKGLTRFLMVFMVDAMAEFIQRHCELH